MRSTKTSDSIAIAGLAGLTGLFYWKILFTNEYTLITAGDNLRQWYCWYQFAAQWIRQGIVPLWDPYTNAGQPFIGDAQAGLFYPLSLPVLALSRSGVAISAIERLIIFSTFLMAVSQFWLCRQLRMSRFSSFVSALTYAFAGFTGTIFFGHLGMFNGAIWLPLTVLFFIKAAESGQLLPRTFFATTCGLFLAVSTLAGNLVPPVYEVIVVLSIALFLSLSRGGSERPPVHRIGRLGYVILICGTAALFIAAVQLIPSAEYARHAVRWVDSPHPLPALAKIPYSVEGGIGSFPAFGFLGFLLPNVAYKTNMYLYVGILPLMFALFGIFCSSARYSRVFVCLLVVSAIYALGSSTILHGLLYSFVPYLYLARLALRAHFILHFAVAVLAGFGADFIINLQSDSPARYSLPALFRSLSIFAWLCGAVVLFLSLRAYLAGDISSQSSSLNEAFLFLMWVVLSVGVLHAGFRLQGSLRTFRFLVITILVLDLFSPVNAAMPLKQNRDGNAALDPIQKIKRDPIVARLLSDKDRYFRINIEAGNPLSYGDAFSLFTLNGPSPTSLERYFDFRGSGWFEPNNLNLLNVKYMISEHDVPGWHKVENEADRALYINPEYLQRAFWVGAARFVDSDQACLKLIQSKAFDPKAALIFVAGKDSPIPPSPEAPAAAEGLAATEGDAQSAVSIERCTPNEIAMTVVAPRDGYLFTSEIWYPGWLAAIDGKPVSIFRADFLFRALPIGRGPHRVVMSYSPGSFRMGLAFTCAGLLAWLVLGIVACRRWPIRQ